MVRCIGVKVFNMPPFYNKEESVNPKKFKALLQKYLHEITSIMNQQLYLHNFHIKHFKNT